jgi:hypothetical protein
VGNQEFQEIGHSGGKVTFKVRTDAEGRLTYEVEWSHARPVPTALFGVYAISEGIAVGDIEMKGMGVPSNPPPLPNCLPVFIASDSEGMFGRQCNNCSGYWRSNHLAKVCPYCGLEVHQSHQFLTDAQHRYVKQYCDVLTQALHGKVDGDYTIDMDAVADAVGQEGERLPFYYSEERQQNLFTCEACGTITDVLGTYAYCSRCATRNDLQELRKTLARIRDTLNSGGANESAAKEAVAVFDSFAAQLAGQLLSRVPMSPRRRGTVEKTRFHNLMLTVKMLRDAFDIDILKSVATTDVVFLTLMFHRRHVYEHKGGEADQKYIEDSGDRVRPKQALRETRESAHRTIGLVAKIAANFHAGFHGLFPPLQEPIEHYGQRRQRGA